MSPTQLRQALRELNGERDLVVAFGGVSDDVAHLEVRRAMLIPDEADHLVKVTDGTAVYVIDAERVAWLKIGLK